MAISHCATLEHFNPLFDQLHRLTPLKVIIVILLIGQAMIWGIIISPKIIVYITLLLMFLALFVFNIEYGVLSIILVVPWAWQSIAFQIGPVSIRASYMLVMIGFSFLLYRIYIAKDLKWVRLPIDIPLLLFLLIALLSIVTSVDSFWSLREFLQLALYIAFYFSVANVLRTRESVIAAANIILLATTITPILGFIGFSAQEASTTGIQRTYAGFQGPNATANYMLMGFPVALALSLVKRKDWKSRLPYIAATAVITATLALTYSRAGWVVAVIIVIALAYLAKIKIKAAAVIFIIVLAMGFSSVPSFQERVSQIFSSEESSNLSHVYIWQSALYAVKEHPIIGVGTGAFSRYYAKHEGTSLMPSPYVFGKRVYYSDSKSKHGVAAHNILLQIWAEVGSIGLMLFLVVIWRFSKTMLSTIKKLTDANDRFLLIGLFLSVIAVLLHNLSITFLVDHFWASLGIAMAGSRILGKMEKQEGITLIAANQ